jgi:hypothetical protein
LVAARSNPMAITTNASATTAPAILACLVTALPP